MGAAECVEAFNLLKPEAGKPEKLSTLLKEDREQLQGKVKIVAKDPEIKKALNERLKAQNFSLTPMAARAVYSRVRCINVRVGNNLDGTVLDDTERKDAEAMWAHIARKNDLYATVFPRFIEHMSCFGNGHLLNWEDPTDDENEEITAVGPQFTRTVYSTTTGRETYSFRQTPVSDGRLRMELFLATGLGWFVEKWINVKPNSGNKIEHWTHDVENAPIGVNDIEKDGTLTPVDGKVWRKQIDANPLFHGRSGTSVDGQYGTAVARPGYGLNNTIVTLTLAANAGLEFAGNPWVLVLADPDLSARMNTGLGAAGRGPTIFPGGNTGSGEKVEDMPAGPDAERVPQQAGGIGRIFGNSATIVDGSGVQNFNEHLEKLDFRYAGSVGIPVHSIRDKGEAQSAPARRAEEVTLETQARQIETRAKSTIESSARAAMLKKGFEIEMIAEFSPFYYYEPEEEWSLANSELNWLKQLDKLAPKVRVQQLVKRGYPQAEAQEISDEMEEKAQQDQAKFMERAAVAPQKTPSVSEEGDGSQES